MKLFNLLLTKLKEKSTWIGIISILSSAGLVINPELSASIVAVGTAIAGMVLVIIKENKEEKLK